MTRTTNETEKNIRIDSRELWNDSSVRFAEQSASIIRRLWLVINQRGNVCIDAFSLFTNRERCASFVECRYLCVSGSAHHMHMMKYQCAMNMCVSEWMRVYAFLYVYVCICVMIVQVLSRQFFHLSGVCVLRSAEALARFLYSFFIL